jgi:beta-N-acetylhexosaminidase
VSSALEELCGQLIVGGFDGTSLPDEMRAALRDGRRAGVILFKRNITSVEQTHSLCSEIAALSNARSPFIAIDQEGGRVRRLPPPCIELPPMRVLGDIGDARLVERAGAAVGAELAAIGFNVDFAPVLDVASNPQNPIIGDRSFAADPLRVSEMGGAFARGLEAAGVLACGKHFPGHGDTELDSHLDLPIVRAPRSVLAEREIAPFRSLSGSLSSMMSAHVVYDALDPGVPATLSHRIATELLRDDLGFEGVLFSDDLEMRALADRHEVEETSVEAIHAGCDVLLICRQFDWQERAHAALVRRAERDLVFRDRCAEAIARTHAVRGRFPSSPAPSSEALWTAMETVEARAVTEEISLRRLGAHVDM